MHDFTLSVTRESGNGLVKYPYCFEAIVNLPAEDVWREWIATLIDYRNTWLWPTRYSQPSVKDGLVEEGGRVVMTYQIPNPYDSTRPDKNVSHEFDITQINEQEMFFEYLTTDSHTFLEGGGAIQVKARQRKDQHHQLAGRVSSRYRRCPHGSTGRCVSLLSMQFFHRDVSEHQKS